MALHRGYTNHNFEAWTIPCLYTAGKYLRAFAIKSDEERSHNDSGAGGLEIRDDFDPEMEKHQQLRDCEQQLKRIFTLCLTDRYEASSYPFYLEPGPTAFGEGNGCVTDITAERRLQSREYGASTPSSISCSRPTSSSTRPIWLGQF